MSIDWKSLQTVAVKPFDSYKPSFTNKLTYSIDENGRGVVFGIKVSINDITTFKITHGVCLKDNTVINFNTDILLPLSETHYAVGNNYVVLKFKYIESRIETFVYPLIDCIPVSNYDPEWHLILASCQIDSNGHIITVDDGNREIIDLNDHQKLKNLQGGDGVDEFYHLTQAQWAKIRNMLDDGNINHNTELSGLEGGDGIHYYHLSQSQYDGIIDIFDGDAPFVLKTGDTMTGVLNMGDHNISDVANAINVDDAVNKGQLDDAVNSIVVCAKTITIDTTSTHNITLSTSDAQIFFIEPDNIGSDTGNEFLILNNGYECRFALVGDVLELRYKANNELAATLTLAADNIDVNFVQDFNGNPDIIITWIAGSCNSNVGGGGTPPSPPSPPSPSVGDRGVFGGGTTSTDYTDTIDYVTISTPGNAIDFGNLSEARGYLSATSNGTNNEGIFAGGQESGGIMSLIDYINISSPGNGNFFMSLPHDNAESAATSNGTNDRGIIGGGMGSQGWTYNINYIDISSNTVGSNYGTLTAIRVFLSATSNGTNDRGVFGGGNNGNASGMSSSNVIDYISISIGGSATDFGNLVAARDGLSATSNDTNDRGVFGGGAQHNGSMQLYLDNIDYITISTPGDATNFGNLTTSRLYLSATSNGINDRAIFGGGQGGTNFIDYITISTNGTAVNFGNLSVARSALAAVSNSLT